MDRQFTAKISTLHYMYLILMAGITIFGMCTGNFVCIALGGLFLLLGVERVVHTTYTVSANGNLQIDNGRFARKQTIQLTDVEMVEKMGYLSVGKRRIFPYVMVVYSKNRTLNLYPSNEDEFIRCIMKRIRELDEL